MGNKREPSKLAQEMIDRFFKGNKILDAEAFAKAREGLPPEDQQFLDDLRDAAFEYEDVEED